MNKVICKICNKHFKKITTSHLKKHNLSYTDYQKKYSYNEEIKSNGTSLDTKNINIDIYIVAYKKYKYWLTAFYLLSLIIFLMMFNYKVLGTLANYNNIKSNYNFLKQVNKYSEIRNSEKYDDLWYNRLRYKPRVTPWANIKKQAASYFSNRKQYLSYIDSMTNFKYHNSIRAFNSRDSLLIFSEINWLDEEIFEIGKLDNRDERINLVTQGKELLKNKLKDSLNSSISIFPLESLKNDVLKQTNIDTSEFLFSLFERVKTESSKVDSLLNYNVSVPNILVPFKSKFLILLSLPLLLVFCCYTQILYLNFKNIEISITKKKSSLFLLPTIKNIFNNLKVYLPFEKKLYFLISLFFNLILPIAVIVFLGMRIGSLYNSYIFLTIIIIFISFELFVFYNTRQRISKLLFSK